MSYTRQVIALAAAALIAAPFFSHTATAAGERAGVAAAVQGKVMRVAYANTGGSGNAVGKDVTSGDSIFLGDTIKSGPGSTLQILLLDQTTFTVGPDSEMVIDKFVYDPATGSGELAATTLKGTFRFISGKIAANDPKAVTIKTPVATMGIRGTSANIYTTISRSLFVLTGPGQNNNTGDRTSRILVSGGGDTREVFRTGFFTEVNGAGTTPTAPQQATTDLLIALFGGLPLGQSTASGGGTGGGGGTGANAGDGGQGTANGLGNAGSANGLNVNNETGEQIINTESPEQVQAFLGSITKVSDLLSIQSGVSTFTTAGVLTAIKGKGGGIFASHTTLNFGDRTVVTQVGAVYKLGRRFGLVTFDNSGQPVSYANDPGGNIAAGVFSTQNAADAANFRCNFGTCGSRSPTVTIAVQFNNNTATGAIAATQNVGLVIDDGTNTIAGSAQAKAVPQGAAPPN